LGEKYRSRGEKHKRVKLWDNKGFFWGDFGQLDKGEAGGESRKNRGGGVTGDAQKTTNGRE